MTNVADDPEYAETKKLLSGRLMNVLQETGDPRVVGDGMTFEKPPFVLPEKAGKTRAKQKAKTRK